MQSVRRFGANEDPNFDVIGRYVREQLHLSLKHTDFSFYDSVLFFSRHPPHHSAGQSNYFAYSRVGLVHHKGLHESIDGKVILLRPGEGTGECSPADHPDFPYGMNPTYEPDNEDAELFVPVGTVFDDNFFPHITCLEEVIATDRMKPKVGKDMNMPQSAFVQMLADYKYKGVGCMPIILKMNLMYQASQFLLDNPNAVYFPEDLAKDFHAYKNFFQIGLIIPLYREDILKVKKMLHPERHPNILRFVPGGIQEEVH